MSGASREPLGRLARFQHSKNKSGLQVRYDRLKQRQSRDAYVSEVVFDVEE